MFTWICPQCGKEVPPHENECPHCSGKAARTDVPQPAAPEEAAPATAPSQPPIPAVETSPSAPAPPPVAPQKLYTVGEQRGLPGWLVALLVAIVLGGLGALAYFYLLPSSRSARMAGQQASPFEAPPAAGESPLAGNRIARLIEVTGFRITESEDKRVQIQFLVVNHSGADIGDLAGRIWLKTTQSGPDDKPVGEFEFKTTRLGPYESIEFKTSMKTSLRAYELPDWQFLRPLVEITSPSEL